ncbi:MAG TPA: phosphoglucosamine mutase [Clostridia bacterium]|nr:phosphoglucosamine mutase [Clostridia bacterium]
MARMFGTDGVRGIANADLTTELAMKIGAAGAYVLTSEVRNPRILVGQDTRRSGDMLSRALAAGICSVGGDVIDCGVVPTPALAYLARLYEADAAVMISASHNTYEYNGIKWFNGEGYKLSDALEDEIEAIVKGERRLPHPRGEGVGHCVTAKRAVEEYEEFLISTASARFDGFHVALDCANGASSRIAREVFAALGARVSARGDEPDGFNINCLCGSTHPERLQELVTELGADVGFAFDGDADRVIAADELGNIVDGDRIMGACARHLRDCGKLKESTLVLTVMSNIGLKRRMKELGIGVEETAVGDRYVMERMREKGYVLGGEQSGHIIFLDLNTTGDGILTAIQVMNILCEKKERMSRLASEVLIYPQVLLNVLVDPAAKERALNDEEMKKRIGDAGAELADAGRVLVRASGTEPLIRIMLEGKYEEQINRLAVGIAKVLEEKYDGRIKQ